MKDIAIEKVTEFQDKFLQKMRLEHQEDVLDVLASGVTNDEIVNTLEKVAAEVLELLV